MTASPQELCLGARISGASVTLASEARRRHLYIVGQTGTGKSTLLLNLIAQDLVTGAGLALLDPHGDLAEAVLLHIPRDRSNDLVYMNPADSERPIGFNPLSAVPEDLKPIVADGVVLPRLSVRGTRHGRSMCTPCGEYGYSDHFRAEAISPIQNKIGKALIEPRLRNMLANPAAQSPCAG